ncbi:MAG TPA: hypothetical protein DEA55_05645 [Rhodospirillaceae bacterium]|nr:hypothetical protein [Rhodospirillaceae bacterium]
MRNIFAICLSVLLFTASSAFAEDAGRDTICLMLPKHRPAADVEYKAGVDVHGNPVVPADVGAPVKPLDGPAVVIPVDINLASRFNLELSPDTGLKPVVAAMKIHADGHVEYYGQDVTKQVHELCSQPAQAAPAPVAAPAPAQANVVVPPAAADPAIVIAPKEPSAPKLAPAPAAPPQELSKEVQGPPAPLLLHPGVPPVSAGQDL